MRSIVTLLLAASLTLSGCIGSGDDAATDEEAAPQSVDDALIREDGTRATEVADATAGLVEEEMEPTLDAPPVWRRGDWFDIELTDQFTGQTWTAKRIVTGTEGDKYLVGMPRDAFSNELMVLHVPGFGRVGQADLSFEVHDVLFEPVKFPLTDGLSWDTAFEGRPVTGTATVTSPTTADVEFIGDNDHITLTYDAEVGTITSFTKDGYGSYEVVASGSDHEGVVTVPHMHDVIFQHGRIAGGVNTALQPAPPMDTVPVDPTYDRVSFALIVGNIAGPPDAPNAVYRELVTAPDGTEYELTATAADGGGLVTAMYQHDEPGGDWNFEHVAAGPGIAMAEGIAYHVFDVVLPQGCILPAEGEHAHGDADCQA